jgi:hypothetical protein
VSGYTISAIFARERVHDLGTGGACAFVHGIDVVHLDRDVRMNMCLDVELHHA